MEKHNLRYLSKLIERKVIEWGILKVKQLNTYLSGLKE